MPLRLHKQKMLDDINQYIKERFKDKIDDIKVETHGSY